MKSLVTGGSGFVGQHLVRKLLERGQSVIIYDKQSPRSKDLILNKNSCWAEGDIRDRDWIRSWLQGVDVVYHSAALVSIADAGMEYYDVNVNGTQIVAEEALKRGVKRFIYLSSSSVYDLAQPMPLTEESIIKNGAKNQYASAKYLGGQVVLEMVKRGLGATIIRPRTIIGKGRGGIFQILYDWLMRGKPVYILGSGDNLFQMVNVDDFCESCILATETETSIGEIFNIGTDKFSTLRQDLQVLLDYADTGSKLLSIPISLAQIALSTLHTLHLSPLVPFHYHSVYKPFYCDISKAQSLLNWQPKYSNQEMLIEAYDWYKGHYKEFKTGTTHIDAPDQKAIKWLRNIS